MRAKQSTRRTSQPHRHPVDGLETGEADSLDTGTGDIGNRTASTTSLTSLTAESSLIIHASRHASSTAGDDGNGTEGKAGKHTGTERDSPAFDAPADTDSSDDGGGGNGGGDVLAHDWLRFGSSFR